MIITNWRCLLISWCSLSYWMCMLRCVHGSNLQSEMN
jgi:hypothetical protein